MSANFPCLNPTCGQVFSPDEIHGKASLTCPRCGTSFQFRTEAAPPPKPAAPVKPAPVRAATPPAPAPVAKARPAKPAAPVRPTPKTPPAVPLATPIQKAPTKAIPLATPVATASPMLPASTPELYFEGRPKSLISRDLAQRARGSWARLILNVALTLIAVGGAAWGAYYGYQWLKNTTVAKEEEVKAQADYRDGVIRFTSPSADWQPDEEARRGLRAAIAKKRGQPRNHLAIHFHDYEKKLPSRAEMIDVALTRLRNYFEPVEWELKPDTSDWKIGELKGFALEFAGIDHNVPITGEVVMSASEGIGYWFFTWGPETQRDDIMQQWPVVRSKLTILKTREGWQETPRPLDTLPLGETPYELRYVKDVWKKRGDVKDWDSAAVAVLLGTDPNPRAGRVHAIKQASARILLLPKAEGELKEAVAKAKAYVIAQQKVDDDTIKEPITEKNKAGSVVDGPVVRGDVPGWLTKWHVINAEDSRERYIVLWIVKLDEGILVVQCDCDWNRRDFWEQEFTPLLESFRKKK